jgi:hypothetical protein
MSTTGHAAYRQIVEEGLLGSAQIKVYEFLDARADFGESFTRNELDAALAPGRPNAGFSRRLAEMEQRGVVQRVGTRACRITQRECDTWTVVPDALPSPRVRPPRRDPQTPPTPSEARRLAAMLRGVLEGTATPHERAQVADRLVPWLAAGASIPANDAPPANDGDGPAAPAAAPVVELPPPGTQLDLLGRAMGAP